MVTTEKNIELVQKTFGGNIRVRRKALGYTLAELAERAGIDRIHLNLIELAKRNTSLKTAQKIADALDATLVELLT